MKGSPQLGGGGYGSSGYGSDSPPPPAYGMNQDSMLDSSPYQSDTKHSPSYGGYNNTYSPPSGHSPQASASGQTTYVTALYDYAAQAEGDLTFAKGDRIQVVQKTQDVNDWWTGSLNGQTGVFPGKMLITVRFLMIALTKQSILLQKVTTSQRNRGRMMATT